MNCSRTCPKSLNPGKAIASIKHSISNGHADGKGDGLGAVAGALSGRRGVARDADAKGDGVRVVVCSARRWGGSLKRGGSHRRETVGVEHTRLCPPVS